MVSLIYGMSSSLDTLMSQEYGAGNYDTCTMYFYKAECISTLISLLMYPLLFLTARALIQLGVDSQVAQTCQEYLLIYYIGSIFWVQSTNLKIYFRIQTVGWPSLAGSLLSLTLYFILMASLLHFYKPSVLLIGLVNTTAFLFQFLFLLALMFCGLGHPQTRRCIRLSDLTQWG